MTARVLERIRSGVEQPNELKSLTDQERRILEYIAQGLTNHEIAQKMFLADKTVKNYVSSVLAKLGLERRTQAAVLATRLLGTKRGKPRPVVSRARSIDRARLTLCRRTSLTGPRPVRDLGQVLTGLPHVVVVFGELVHHAPGAPSRPGGRARAPGRSRR